MQIFNKLLNCSADSSEDKVINIINLIIKFAFSLSKTILISFVYTHSFQSLDLRGIVILLVFANFYSLNIRHLISLKVSKFVMNQTPEISVI